MTDSCRRRMGLGPVGGGEGERGTAMRRTKGIDAENMGKSQDKHDEVVVDRDRVPSSSRSRLAEARLEALLSDRYKY